LLVANLVAPYTAQEEGALDASGYFALDAVRVDPARGLIIQGL
jgi:hypothetical protein